MAAKTRLAVWLEVRRPGEVAWTSLTDGAYGDWVAAVSAPIGTPDQPVRAFDVRLFLKADGQGISPGLSNAAINRDAGNIFSPIIYAGRYVRAYYAKLGPNDDRATATKIPWWAGRVDEVEIGDDVRFTVLNPDAELIETRFESDTTRTPASGNETAIEVEVQNLLDLKFGAGVYPLTVIGVPGWGVGEYEVKAGDSLGNQIREMVRANGWEVRHLWNEVSGEWEYTMWEVDRDRVAIDYTYGPGDVIQIPNISITRRWVRNNFVLTYVNSSGQIVVRTLKNGTLDPPTGSIGDYGELTMIMNEGPESPIKDDISADALLALADHDLSEPPTDKRIRVDFDDVRLHERLLIQANGLHFDYDTDWSVVGGTLEVSDEDAYAELDLRAGSPVGMYYGWHTRKGTGATVFQAEYSPDATENDVSPTFRPAWDQFMRHSADEGRTWTDWYRIVGEVGNPGEDGSYTDYKFQAATTVPAVSANAEDPGVGWLNNPPDTNPDGNPPTYLWMIKADRNADGTLITPWSSPVKLTGPAGPTGPAGTSQMFALIGTHWKVRGDTQLMLELQSAAPVTQIRVEYDDSSTGGPIADRTISYDEPLPNDGYVVIDIKTEDGLGGYDPRFWTKTEVKPNPLKVWGLDAGGAVVAGAYDEITPEVLTETGNVGGRIKVGPNVEQGDYVEFDVNRFVGSVVSGRPKVSMSFSGANRLQPTEGGLGGLNPMGGGYVRGSNTTPGQYEAIVGIPWADIESGALPLARLPNHANRHATGGVDEITPVSIGAAASNHGHDLTTSSITGVLPAGKGGTGFDFQNLPGVHTGSIIYYNDTTEAWVEAPIGTEGHFLKVVSGVPQWASISASTVATPPEANRWYRATGATAGSHTWSTWKLPAIGGQDGYALIADLGGDAVWTALSWAKLGEGLALPDARLTSNVPLKNAQNTFTDLQTVNRAVATDAILVTQAGVVNWGIRSDGRMYWGTNSSDTNLYRHAASHLRTDDNFSALAYYRSTTLIINSSGVLQNVSMSASLLTGTIDEARLPIVPTSKGGTGADLSALTAGLIYAPGTGPLAKFAVPGGAGMVPRTTGTAAVFEWATITGLPTPAAAGRLLQSDASSWLQVTPESVGVTSFTSGIGSGLTPYSQAKGAIDLAVVWGDAPLVTTTTQGMMSAADKAKLNGIGAGANVSSVFGRTGAVVAAAGDYSGIYEPAFSLLPTSKGGTGVNLGTTPTGLLRGDGAALSMSIGTDGQVPVARPGLAAKVVWESVALLPAATVASRWLRSNGTTWAESAWGLPDPTGAMTGNVLRVTGLNAVAWQALTAGDVGAVPLSGGTMTGALTLAAGDLYWAGYSPNDRIQGGSGALYFMAGGDWRFYTGSSFVSPYYNNSITLGSTTLRWSTIYGVHLNLTGNQTVDGQINVWNGVGYRANSRAYFYNSGDTNWASIFSFSTNSEAQLRFTTGGNSNVLTMDSLGVSTFSAAVHAPSFSASQMYASDWFRSSGNTGLYNSTHLNHFWASSANYWVASVSSTLQGGLVLYGNNQLTLKGYLYWDSSGFGLLNDQGGWSVLCYQGASFGGELRGAWKSTGSFTATTYFTSASTREVKTDIRLYDGRGALDLLRRTPLFWYRFIDDKTREQRLGYIAEETDPLLSGHERRLFKPETAIGVAFAAIKEQDDEVTRLRRRVQYLEDQLGIREAA